MQGRGIKCVYFRTPLKNGAGTLALIEYADGLVAVVHDDRVVAGCEWESAELEAAVAGYSQVQRKLEGPRAEAT